MLQYLAWIGIYILSIKFMTKNAGRNSPIWGASFVLFSFLIEFFMGAFVVMVSPILPFLSSNKLVFGLSVMILSFIVILSIAFLLSKLLKKKDLSKISKETSINYKLTAIILGIIGLSMLFMIYIMTNKFDSWLMSLIFLAVAQSLQLEKRKKLNKEIKINDLKNQDYLLFLRDFHGENNIKIDKVFSWAEKGDIDKYISSLIPSKIISFGNPEDYLPNFGSTKVYTDNESWKETIKEYIINSKKILILEGLSEGLIWELKYIRENISPSKVLIITYPSKYKDSKSYKKYMDYKDFSNQLYSIGYNLPTMDIGAEVLLSFDKNWNVKIEDQGTKFLSEYFKNIKGVNHD